MEHTVDPGNVLWFAGWLVAIAVLFVLGVRLPLQTRLRRAGAWVYAAAVVVVSIALVVTANAGLVLHDAYVDLTKEKVFTPSEQAMKVVDGLERDVAVTYFYQSQDPNARRLKDILDVMAKRNAHLHVRAIDPDKQPTLAENYGIKLYNAAVLESEGRRVIVQTTDETDVAIGIQRVLRERVIAACFLEGHNELPMDNFEFHTHLEGTGGHSHGDAASNVVQMAGHGIGRLRRSLEALGYDARKIVLATQQAVPQDCALVIDASPRTLFLPAEGEALRTYLRNGGSALFLFDLGFVLEPRLAQLLADYGVRPEQKVVIDPLSHYSTDAEMVAITGYSPNPVTQNVSMTFFPGVRPLDLVTPAVGIRTTSLFESSRDSYTRSIQPVQSAGAAMRGEKQDNPAHRPSVLGAIAEGTLPGGTQPSRVIVVGDGDFASNSFLPYMANSDLALAMVRWLAKDERATAIASRIPVPATILLTQPQMRTIFLLLEVALPLSIIAMGAGVWWRRR